jgi:hypothetical protein
MIDVNQITTTLRGMADRALQQYAMMNKTNPYILSLAVAESNQRKQLRTAAQARNMAPQPKVADAAIAGIAEAPPAVDAMGNVTGMAAGGLPEDQGIGRLPTPNIQRMADGGIAGYDDEEGMATGGMGGMFNFAQQSEPVVRMSGGGVPGYAGGVFNSASFREFLKAKNIDEKAFSSLDFSEKEKVLNDFKKETAGPQKTAPTPKAATPTAATPAPTKEGLLYNPAKLAGQATKATTTALKGVPYVSGAVGAYQGVSALNDASDFYNDPNVPTLEKAKQAGLTTVKAGLPIAGAGLGSFFSPAGTFVGGLAGTAASEYIDLETDALKEWKKANPKATPEQTKKAAAALAPAYDGPKINAAQAERATTGQPTVTPVPEDKPASNTGGVRDLLPSTAGLDTSFKPAAAPTADEAIEQGEKIFNSKARIGEINRQVLQEQTDANRAKENSIEALKAFNEKQGPAYAGYEKMLQKEELQDATDKEKAGLTALFKGFLAIAAGESPNAATNIAKGSMAGLEEYSGAMKEFKKAAKERNKEMQNIQQARRAEERGDFDKFQMYEDRANTASQAAARYGLAAINDITNTSGKVNADILQNMRTITSSENIAGMREAGANKRAVYEQAGANARAQTPEKILFDQLRSKYGGDALRATEEMQKLKSEKFNLYDAYTKYLMAFANKEGVSPPDPFDVFAKRFVPEITPNKNTTVRTQPGG